MTDTIQSFPPFGSYPIEELLKVRAPPPPDDFEEFWTNAYSAIQHHDTKAQIRDTGTTNSHWKVFDIHFVSTDSIVIGGWLLLPKKGQAKRAFVVGHGYGGRDAPDTHLPFPDAALFFPCCRGISRSPAPPISSNPHWHVLHDIDKKERYILRGCVEDTWLAVSVIESLLPELKGKIGYMGISFGGGIGAMALAWDKRIAKAHFNVPTFGHHRLRMRIDTSGSGKALQNFYKTHARTALRTLAYYDAANAASFINVPVHFAPALKDPVVTPPGQFAIYNQVQSTKQLYVLDEGHADYKNKKRQHRELLKELKLFFSDLSEM